jgi:hypothetical protein
VRPEPAGLGLAGVADAAQLLADGGAVDAADRAGLVERERAGIDQAAHGVGLEAHALLVGEGDQRRRGRRVAMPASASAWQASRAASTPRRPS